MKQCRECKAWKEDEEFNWRWKNKGIRQPVCRACEVNVRKNWYDANADKVKEKTAVDRRSNREAANLYIYEFLSRSTCMDCGEYDFAVLTFDHVRGKKRMAVSEMAAKGFPIETIQEEINKCEVVYFNCHMRRENERRSGGRYRRFWPKWPWEK